MRKDIEVSERFPKKLKFAIGMAGVIAAVLVFNMIVLAWRL